MNDHSKHAASRQKQQRREARKRALQAIYQWDMSDGSPSAIVVQFLETQDMRKSDIEYFKELLSGVAANRGQIDSHITPAIDRELDLLDPIERSILRLAVYELIHRFDIPYRVVLNEAVDLTKLFGAEQGHKYVNGVLDKVAAVVRTVEFNAARDA